MLSLIRINILYLETVLIKQGARRHNLECKISNEFTENLILSSAKANTSYETKNVSCNLVTWICKTWNGKTWNSKTWNGKTWNGKTWNGKTWNGKTWNGKTWNGKTWNGKTWICKTLMDL